MATNARVVELMKEIEQSDENRLKQLIVPITNYPIDPTFPKETATLIHEYEDQRVHRWIIVLSEHRVKKSKNKAVMELLRILRPTMDRGTMLARQDFLNRYPGSGKKSGKTYVGFMLKNPEDYEHLRKSLPELDQDPHGDTLRKYTTNSGRIVQREVSFTLTPFAKSKMHISAAKSIEDALTANHTQLVVQRGWSLSFSTEAIHWGNMGCRPLGVMHTAFWEIGVYDPREFGPMYYRRSPVQRLADIADTAIPKKKLVVALKADFKASLPTSWSQKELKNLIVQVLGWLAK